ncbi:MAG: DUF4189 domain-containing protein [Hyphomicrobiaceae bacterium]
MRGKAWVGLGLGIAVAMATGLGPSLGEGALAIGQVGSVAKNGIAMGWAVGQRTEGDAKATALKECLAFTDAPAATRAACKVVRTFKAQCLSIALDPKAGTPGVGWSVANTAQAAEETAMAECRRTAGKAREKFCKITASKCDAL